MYFKEKLYLKNIIGQFCNSLIVAVKLTINFLRELDTKFFLVMSLNSQISFSADIMASIRT